MIPIGILVTLLKSQNMKNILNCSTFPVIAPANSRIFHNVLVTPGPAAASDHIPVIITISANPIQIPNCSRREFVTAANWTAFQQKLLTIPTLI